MSERYKIVEDDKDFSDINIIPLVDVMLVLLIIFMVTAPLSIGGIKVQIPVSKARTSQIDEDRIILTINKHGEFYIDENRIDPSILQSKLSAIYEFRKKKELYIRADSKVFYEKVVEAMSAAKLAGVTKMSMLTQAPKS